MSSKHTVEQSRAARNKGRVRVRIQLAEDLWRRARVVAAEKGAEVSVYDLIEQGLEGLVLAAERSIPTT